MAFIFQHERLCNSCTYTVSVYSAPHRNCDVWDVGVVYIGSAMGASTSEAMREMRRKMAYKRAERRKLQSMLHACYPW